MGTTDLWPRSARSMLIKGHAGEAPFDGSLVARSRRQPCSALGAAGCARRGEGTFRV